MVLHLVLLQKRAPGQPLSTPLSRPCSRGPVPVTHISPQSLQHRDDFPRPLISLSLLVGWFGTIFPPQCRRADCSTCEVILQRGLQVMKGERSRELFMSLSDKDPMFAPSSKGATLMAQSSSLNSRLFPYFPASQGSNPGRRAHHRRRGRICPRWYLKQHRHCPTYGNRRRRSPYSSRLWLDY